MALPAAFLDELRARTPMAALVGRKVKLERSGKSWKGCCPFHNEKTASFYVYDDGYHCFGCGAHGDAIGFVMQTEGAAFIESVERLAGEAGLEVPKSSPQAAEAERQRLDLSEVLDRAGESFIRRLHAPEGREALAYLRNRGLTDDTIHRFGLGWSGEGRGDLVAELGRAGVDPARMAEAGLLQSRDDGSVRELFYQRVMFPIRDRRGRIISFGGRALRDVKPKYINGPETTLYSKSRTLYGLDLAREGARKPPGVIVVEGYMDVIALHQAGFSGAVAPLGTALTAEHLQELWRLADAPTLCFDGDAAGARAAAKAAEVALPKVTPHNSLRFASLPEGEDPDTLIRNANGVAIFTEIIDRARPFHTALFEFIKERHLLSTPEGRAAFKTAMISYASLVKDRTLAIEYKRTWIDNIFRERPTRQQLKVTKFVRTLLTKEAAILECKRNIVAIIITHPSVLSDLQEAFSLISLPGSWANIRRLTLHWWDTHHDLDSGALLNHLSASSAWPEVEEVLNPRLPLPLAACVKPDAMPADIERDWYHFFGFLGRDGIELDRNEAVREWIESGDPAAFNRAVGLQGAFERLVKDLGIDLDET